LPDWLLNNDCYEKTSFTPTAACYLQPLFLIVSFSQKSYFKAVNDTVDLVPGIPTTFNLMANDIFTSGDTIHLVLGINCYGILIKDSTVTGIKTFTAIPGYNVNCHGSYMLYKLANPLVDTSHAQVFFRIHDHSFDSLNINNI